VTARHKARPAVIKICCFLRFINFIIIPFLF
jgi:hypothetical protein